MTKKLTLQDLIPNDTTEMPVIHPVHGDLGITLTIKGMWAPELQLESLKSIRLVQNPITDETPDSEVESRITKLQAAKFKLYAKAIVGWSDEQVLGPYSPAKALELISNPKMYWLVDQVRECLDKVDNFFRKSQASAITSNKK